MEGEGYTDTSALAHLRGLFQARFRPVWWCRWRPCCWRCRFRWCCRRGTQGGGEEGRGYDTLLPFCYTLERAADAITQRRRSRTTIWDSVSSTKRSPEVETAK
jgi:hypothetical protein